MLQALLTLMLLILPFLISKKDISQSGLYTGLWLSLFFWGRIHPLFSLLTFGAGLCYYVYFSKERTDTPENFIPRRPGLGALIGFLAVMIMFCAFGTACSDLAPEWELHHIIQQSALILGFVGSLSGPIFFGCLSDKMGPFTAFTVLFCLAFAGVICTALSQISPYWFPFGHLLLHAVISGYFVLMPLFLLRFYGKSHLTRILPFLFLFLTGLWFCTMHYYQTDRALPQDYLLCMFFLLFLAVPLANYAWQNRFVLLSNMEAS